MPTIDQIISEKFGGMMFAIAQLEAQIANLAAQNDELKAKMIEAEKANEEGEPQ